MHFAEDSFNLDKPYFYYFGKIPESERFIKLRSNKKDFLSIKKAMCKRRVSLEFLEIEERADKIARRRKISHRSIYDKNYFMMEREITLRNYERRYSKSFWL